MPGMGGNGSRPGPPLSSRSRRTQSWQVRRGSSEMHRPAFIAVSLEAAFAHLNFELAARGGHGVINRNHVDLQVGKLNPKWRWAFGSSIGTLHATALSHELNKP